MNDNSSMFACYLISILISRQQLSWVVVQNYKVSSDISIRNELILDIPKLEQLIMTRLRSIIQDRLVYPNHLTLTLPRLQTTQQGVPIVTDLGQRAVEAVREGISQAAADLMNLGPGPDSLPPASINSEQQESHLPSPPASPPLGRKRIPMPAGFPGYSNIAMDSPGLTPTPADSRRQQRPQISAQSSALRIPGGLPPTGRTSSVAPSSSRGLASGQDSGNNNSQFRFRGQFASQPPTPGVGIGALNSRAP
jgi:maintenance of morphology protein 1